MFPEFRCLSVPCTRAQSALHAIRPKGLVVWAVAVLLAGCSHAPPAPRQAPALEVPAAFREASLFAPANPAAADVPDAWWTLFNDPVLDRLHTTLLRDNIQLQSAAAAVANAQAALAASRASLWPAVNLSLGASRSRSATGAVDNSFSLQGGLSNWELDLWNRLGAGTDAATARLQASGHTLAATRLSLQATLTQTYFSLRAAQALSDILGQTVLSYRKTLELAQNRYQGGVTSAADVAQAQVQLKSAQAQQLEARLQRTQLEHALALLLGRAPAAFDVPAPASTATAALAAGLPTPPVVPLQLPSSLLERRPDIAAAERQVAAANAQVGAAEAAFFPAVALSVSGGLRNGDWRDLLQAGSRVWALGPTVALNVFDGGAREASRDAARATRDQAVAAYRQTVLTALQEVEDNLAAAHLLQEETALQREALAAAQRALDIAHNQYRAGTVSYLNVVTAQTAVLTAERSLLDARNRHLAAVNQLLKNLAGRWT